MDGTRLAGEALRLVGDACYEWNLQTDHLVWDPAVADILGVRADSRIATGAAYAALTASQKGTSRDKVVRAGTARDGGDGVAYHAEYTVTADDGGTRWIEDRGRWFADASGAPSRAVGIVRDVTERREREERLVYLSSYDQLTGHLNRIQLKEVLNQTLAHNRRYRSKSAFLLAAVDNLGIVNHNYGYDVADQVIVEVGKRIERVLRVGDAIGRTAGNKFGLVLADCADGRLRGVVRRLQSAARDAVVETNAGPVSVTISVGCVTLPESAQSAYQAMARAEEALAGAKLTGRNAWAVFEASPERDSRRQFNIAIADQLVSALNDRRIRLAYQPIVNAQTREPVWYESLLRMEKPSGDILPAQWFVPIAEQLGLMRLLDHRAMEIVLHNLIDHPEARLTLNVSGYTMSDKAWLDTLVAALRSVPEIAERLMVEITETVAVKDAEDMARFVSRARDLGCKVAIDDFGAGYTSFRNLKMLGVDMVKIDGSFVEDIGNNPANLMFVRSFVDLARNFSIPTVAEWVTREEDAALLADIGVEYLQGYYFGEPTLEAPWHDAGETTDRAADGATGSASG